MFDHMESIITSMSNEDLQVAGDGIILTHQNKIKRKHFNFNFLFFKKGESEKALL